jgi:hypothetical protein
MTKVKYLDLLPPSVKNRVVTIKIELGELAGMVSGTGDKTLIDLVNNALTAVEQLDEYTWKVSE